MEWDQILKIAAEKMNFAISVQDLFDVTITDVLIQSGSSEDDMNTRICVNETRHLTYFQSKRSFFEGSLHLSLSKEAEISSILCRAAFAWLLSNSGEIFGTLNLIFECFNVGDGLVLGSRHLHVSLVSDYWVARLRMLLQDMAAFNLGHLCSQFLSLNWL